MMTLGGSVNTRAEAELQVTNVIMPQTREDNMQPVNNMMRPWVQRAMTPGSGSMQSRSGEPQTVFTETAEFGGRYIVYPTIRQGPKGLYQMQGDEAYEFAVRQGDFIAADTMEEANQIAAAISEQIWNARPDLRK